MKLKGYNRYAAGNKVYAGGRPNPTMGPVDRTGYIERDLKGARLRRNALLRRMKAKQKGRFMSPEYLRGEK